MTIKIVGDCILDKLGNQELINRILRWLSEIIIPVKRDKFIELSTSRINICPIGRSCSFEEREHFYQYDQEHQIRKKLTLPARLAV